MKTSLWTIAATCLLVVCTNSCGSGGKNYPADLCNRLQVCGDLSLMGAATVAECKATVNQRLGAMADSERTTAEQAWDQCLATADCPSFTSCMSPLVQSDHATALCKQLQTCGAISLLGTSATIADCQTYANQILGALTGTQQLAANLAIGQCAAQTDCTAFLSCISNLVSQVTGTTAPSTDYATTVCNKLDSCGSLATVGATTVETCTAAATQLVSAIPSSLQAAAQQAINGCLAMSDCTLFTSCLNALKSAMGGH
jgi:hypothetical protein